MSCCSCALIHEERWLGCNSGKLDLDPGSTAVARFAGIIRSIRRRDSMRIRHLTHLQCLFAASSLAYRLWCLLRACATNKKCRPAHTCSQLPCKCPMCSFHPTFSRQWHGAQNRLLMTITKGLILRSQKGQLAGLLKTPTGLGLRANNAMYSRGRSANSASIFVLQAISTFIGAPQAVAFQTRCAYPR
jgi:hypothetical protein